MTDSIRNRLSSLLKSSPPKPPEKARGTGPQNAARQQPLSVQDGFDRKVRPQFQTLMGGSLPGLSTVAQALQGAEVQRLGGPSGTQPTEELTSKEKEQAQEILGSGDPEKLNEWLAENPDPGKQAAMMGYIFQANEAMGVLLSKYMSPEAMESIAGALNGAVEAGLITPEQIAESAAYTGDGTSYGQIIGLTQNPELIQTFVDGVMAPTGQGDDGIDPRRAQAAAYALAGLPPADLEAYLNTAEGIGQMEDIVALVNGNGDERTQEALGALLSSAAKIPHTQGADGRDTVSQGVADLFAIVTPQLGENEFSLAGAAEFFQAHGDALLRHPSFSDEQTGHLTERAERTLNEFFARTMFQGVEFEGQAEFNEWTSQWLGDLTTALSAVPEEEATGGESSATPDQREDAVRLGGIIGSIENGFRTAVEVLEKKNEAIEGMVDFVFKAKDLIPGIKFPGADKAVDASVDVVRDWVVGLLEHDIPGARESLPFHDQFSQQIDNQDLRESYGNGRTEVLVNDGIAGIRD